MAPPKRKPRADGAPLKRAEAVLEALSSPVPPTADEVLAEFGLLTKSYRALERRLYKTVCISDGYQQQVKDLAGSLEGMATKMRQLSEVVLPLCVRCRKVRSDDDYWERMESFFASNVEIMFSQSICPECIRATHTDLGPIASGHASESGGVPLEVGKAPGRRRRSKTRLELPEESAVTEFRALVGKTAAAIPELSGELDVVVERFAKLSRRFNKTLTISDSYQSQLRELNLRLEVLARTDLLTGLANRWEMASRLEVERSLLERHGTVFSIIMGDVDHFKEVNDAHGHLAGDSVLRAVANALRRSLRGEDLCARWGGEEFMILLPRTDAIQAQLVAEKLNVLVRETVSVWAGHPISVTMSFGVGAFQRGMTIDGGIKRVDDAMYAAKEKGRNTVVAAGE